MSLKPGLCRLCSFSGIEEDIGLKAAWETIFLYASYISQVVQYVIPLKYLE